MVVKAQERKAVNMLQLLFAASNITDAEDGLEYIKNFHTNMKIDDSMSVDSLIDALDTFVIKNESMTYEAKEKYRQISEDVKLNLNYFLPEPVSESSLNVFKVRKDINGNTTIYEAREPSAKDVIGAIKDGAEIFQKQLVPSDVKKANELVPTTMVIQFISTSNGEAIPTQMLVGVKAKMYPVDSMDIVNRISLKYKDNNNLIKFIRSTTREISFFKAKIDALSQSKRGSSSPLWKILERRSKKSRIRRILGQPNDASAITTLIVSQEEVEYLKKSESIDLENPKVARSIMESYNFMSLVIVDESMEVAKFIYDTGDDVYESLAFSSLERESNDSSTKKIVNLMTKMSR